ncbi:SSI family serine proteinase inhibitor [Streptomyces sp. NPDC093094]|uniref:SSI family serine proteinase inhibitor n=1 Tax=Streptomyces sp. NPDC093094 TaxID=3366026 RepID=UPI003822260B
MSYVTSGSLRRLAVAAGACLAAAGSLSAAPVAAASHAGAVPSPSVPPVIGGDPPGGRLTVTVRDAGGGADGTYELRCGPSGGSHPDPAGACRAVERRTRWGEDPFAPVPDGSVCTMLYGGPATAHVTGTWAGRPVDARFDRTDGCETDRWERFVPLLPATGR